MDARRIEHIHKEASEERRTLRGGDGLSSHFAGLCLELLEHVAKQDAQAAQSKAAMAPHVFAQMVNMVRDLAFDFGTSEQFRDRAADLLGKYIHVEHGSKGEPEQTEAPAVVVPAWDVNAFALACVKEGAYAEGDLRDAIKNAEMGYNFAISSARAIPADRVLGEGMMAVDREELEALRRFAERCAQRDHQPDEHIGSAKCVACEAEDALRANQGGAAR